MSFNINKLYSVQYDESTLRIKHMNLGPQMSEISMDRQKGLITHANTQQEKELPLMREFQTSW